MEQLIKIRKQLKFEKDMCFIMGNLRDLASASYIKTKELGNFYSRFVDELKNFAAFINLPEIDHPFVRNDNPVKAYILVTPDSGLMGGLNSKIIAEYENRTSKLPTNPVTIVLGERGANAIGIKDNVFPFAGYRETKEDITKKIEQIKEQTSSLINDGRIGSLEIIYPTSLSFSKQDVRVDLLMPCRDLISNLEPKDRDIRETLVESSASDLVNYLMKSWFDIRIYMALKDAKLAEYSARAIHLSGCHAKLEKQLKLTEIKLNDLRKDLIDKQVRETSTVQLLRKKQREEQLRRARRN
jgi:ATP synthase F1 gamma subunit